MIIPTQIKEHLNDSINNIIVDFIEKYGHDEHTYLRYFDTIINERIQNLKYNIENPIVIVEPENVLTRVFVDAIPQDENKIGESESSSIYSHETESDISDIGSIEINFTEKNGYFMCTKSEFDDAVMRKDYNENVKFGFEFNKHVLKEYGKKKQNIKHGFYIDDMFFNVSCMYEILENIVLWSNGYTDVEVPMYTQILVENKDIFMYIFKWNIDRMIRKRRQFMLENFQINILAHVFQFLYEMNPDFPLFKRIS